MGTLFLTYTAAMISVTVINFETVYLPAYVGVISSVLIILFIYGTAPASGMSHRIPELVVAQS